MATGSISLTEYPGDMVIIACDRCERQGRLSKAGLIADHGLGLPREKWSDLRERFWLNMNLGFGGIYEPRKTKNSGTDYQLST